MAFSNWLCTNNTRNMLVKIVHPGGHVELHDRPVLAAEIMLRNPRHCVALPRVFQQPWAIVAPDTTLMPGQKFYVVPMGTIRKLQKLSLRYSPCLVQEMETKQDLEGEGEGDGRVSTCWLFINRKKKPNSCGVERDGQSSDDNCFACLLTAMKDSGDETRSSSSNIGLASSEKGTSLIRKGGSPKRNSSFNHWHPNLKSISEE